MSPGTSIAADLLTPEHRYQLWLNLTKKNKCEPPQFTMQWAEEVPVIEHNDGGRTVVTLIAGEYGGKKALPPPVASYASDPESDLAIWLLEMEAGAKVTLPATKKDATKRMLYVHGDGARVRVGADTVDSEHGFEPTQNAELPVVAETPSKILLLQAVEIDEPVVIKGPFVMNAPEEIDQAYRDYKATHFGWDEVWKTQSPVYPRDQGRFANFGDGKKVYPPKQ